jgi:hypothetical protein
MVAGVSSAEGSAPNVIDRGPNSFVLFERPEITLASFDFAPASECAIDSAVSIDC